VNFYTVLCAKRSKLLTLSVQKPACSRADGAGNDLNNRVSYRIGAGTDAKGSGNFSADRRRKGDEIVNPEHQYHDPCNEEYDSKNFHNKPLGFLIKVVQKLQFWNKLNDLPG
jgi:hypothetical protein